MTPKKVVPKGTDDIIELTDIVEPGVLPNESAGAGLTDATFEDELDSMLADAPELSAAAKDMGAAPEAGSSFVIELVTSVQLAAGFRCQRFGRRPSTNHRAAKGKETRSSIELQFPRRASL